MEHQQNGISESRFFMWRAVFAMAHADDIITDEERKFMNEVLGREPFNEEQRAVLTNDIDEKQDIYDLFRQITDQDDRSEFFSYSRMLCWSDGDFDKQEQEIMIRLKKSHTQEVDFDKMVGTIKMEIDDDHDQAVRAEMEAARNAPRESIPMLNFFNRIRKSS